MICPKHHHLYAPLALIIIGYGEGGIEEEQHYRQQRGFDETVGGVGDVVEVYTNRGGMSANET